MRAWGHAPWGRFGWGHMFDPVLGPQIIYQAPAPGALDVDAGSVFEVRLEQPEGVFDETILRLYLDGVLLYDGVTGFAPGVVGRVQRVGEVVSIQCYAPEGLHFGSRPVLRVTAVDLDASWSFSVRDNPACYSGHQALPVEQQLQQPYDGFLALEPMRRLVLSKVLRSGLPKVSGNKAARAVYQLAFATELATVQNLFRIKDPSALRVTVCEKENPLVLDRAFAPERALFEDGIKNLHEHAGLSDAYAQSFREYLDANHYLYRVSLACNMVLYAAAYEYRQRV